MKRHTVKVSEERRAFVEEFALASVALVLADALEASGLSQRELGERLGLSEARISQILAADSNPTVRTLARIADALGVELKVGLVERHHAPREMPPWDLLRESWDTYLDSWAMRKPRQKRDRVDAPVDVEAWDVAA
jgi:transcriptional regulator with XRE-family HTH domain